MMNRLLLLVVLLGVGGLAGCSSMSKLDQGLYSVTDSVAGRDRVTGARTLSMASRQQMIADKNAEMDKAFADAKAQGLKLNADLDAAGYARVQRISQRLLQVSHFADERAQWKVFLLPDPSFNAFVNGGSYIMVNKGLLDQVQSDDEVAAVIGHEVAHNAANHIGERSTYQQAAMLAGSKSVQRNTFQQSFSLTQEAEADRIGILYAALAGYDPYAASRVWQRLYQAQGNQTVMSDHPLSRDRIAQTQAVADKVKPYYKAGQVNPDAANLLVNNALWSRQADALQAGSGGGLAALAETTFNAYLTRQNTKSVEKSQQAHAQKVANVSGALQVVSQTALDASRLQVTLVYRGNAPLTVLTMAAVGPNNSRAVAHAAAPVMPGQSFTLVFDGGAVALGQQAASVRLTVDDADY